MYYAQHTIEDVEAFWKASPFDLELPHGSNMYGNCVGCFLKSRTKLEMIMAEEPHHFDWWIKAEALKVGNKPSGAFFRNDRPTYAQMMAQVKAQGTFAYPDDDSLPCMCTD